MRKRLMWLSPIFILLTMTTGCVSYSLGIEKEGVPDPNMGYLMGRFTQDGGDTLGIGLKISCDGRCEEKIIRFKRAVYGDVIAVGVAPGMYRVESIVYSYQNGYGLQNLQSEKPLTIPALTKPFNVESGKIYYIVDILGEANFTAQRQIHWKVKNISYSPEKTKKEFFEAHPSFNGMDVFEPLRPQ